MKKVFFLPLLSGISVMLYGQDCEETLRRANIEFERGHFVGVPVMLEHCLVRGFTEEQKARAYNLLTHVYILLGHQKEADDSYLKLLEANPDFKPTVENDPIAMVYLSRKFTSTPIYESYLFTGVSTTRPTFQESLNLNPYNNDFQHRLNIGVEAGMGRVWNLSDRWAAGAELIPAYRVVGTLFNHISGDNQMKVSERMLWVDLPVYIKYSFHRHKSQPYIFGGMKVNLLLLDNSLIDGTDNTQAGGGGTPVPGSPVIISNSRNRFNYSAMAGLGLRRKRGRGYWFIDLRVTIGLSPLVNPRQNYYSNDNPSELSANVTQYRWVSSFYRLHYASLSVGYVFPKYQPRKISDNFFARIFWGKKHPMFKKAENVSK